MQPRHCKRTKSIVVVVVVVIVDDGVVGVEAA